MVFTGFLIHPFHDVVSKPDGNLIATAAGQLKTFGSSDHKKMQKFSGHPVSLMQGAPCIQGALFLFYNFFFDIM